MNTMRKYIFYMDRVSDWSGKIACWLIVPLAPPKGYKTTLFD